jgi:hypothetical protein
MIFMFLGFFLERALVAGVGLFLWLILGYLLLSAIDRPRAIAPPIRFFLSIPLFYLFPWIAYCANFLTSGLLFSKRETFLVVLGMFVISTIMLSAKRISRDLMEIQRQARSVLKETSWVQGFVFILVMAVAALIPLSPLLSGMSLGGDINKHIMYVNQLLRGYPVSSLPPYDSFARFVNYPFLLHSAMAFWVQLLGTNIFSAYFLMHAAQALFLPLGLYVLVGRWTSSYWFGILAVVLVTLYGGHNVPWVGDVWFFNVAIERILPHHVTRMSSLTMIPFFLFCLHEKLYGNGGKTLVIIAGLILGLMGSIHTYPFVWGTTVALSLLTPSRRGGLSNVELLKIVAVGIAMATIAYIPYLHLSKIEWLKTAKECRGILWVFHPGQMLLNGKRALNYFGILLLPGILSILFWRSSVRLSLKRAIVVGSVSLLFITYLKGFLETRYIISLPYHPAQQKFGKAFFITLALMACDFLAFLSQKREKVSRGVLKWLVAVGVSPVIIAGLVSTMTFASIWTIHSWRGYRNKAFLMDDSLTNVMERQANKKESVAVPSDISKIFASMTGAHLLYMAHPKSHSHTRFLFNSILYVDDHMAGMMEKRVGVPYKEAVREILETYEIGYLVSPNTLSNRFKAMGFLRSLGQGRWKDGRGFEVFRVERKNSSKKRRPMNNPRLLRILSSSYIWEKVAGFYPLCKERLVRPRIMARRDMKVHGMAFDGEFFWLYTSNDRRIIRISAQDGRPEGPPLRLKNGLHRLAWGDGRLWVLDAVTGEIRFFRGTGEKSHVLGVWPVLKGSYGLAWGNGGLWAYGREDKTIYFLPCKDFRPRRYATMTDEIYDLAYAEGEPWVLLSNGRICQVKSEGVGEGLCFASPAEDLSKVTWSDEGLWGLDSTSKALILYYTNLPGPASALPLPGCP